MKNLILHIIIVIFASLTCYGQNEDIIVSFNPKGNLSLGAGIDVNNPRESKQQAINFDSIKAIDGGSPNTTLTASLIKNTEEYFRALNIDINRNGEINVPVLGGGNFEIDLKTNLTREFSNNTLYYVVHAFNDFGRFELQNINLKQEFKALLQQNQHSDFIRSCGTYFVKRERRASSVYAIIKISNLNKIDKKRIEVKHSSNLNFNIKNIAEVKGSEKNNFDLFIKNVSKVGNLEINYYARGTAGLSVLGTVNVDTTFSLSSILNTLNSAIRTATPENAVPIEYHLTSFNSFGLNTPKFEPENWKCISKLINNKVNLTSQISKIRDIIKDFDDKPFISYYKSKLIILEQKNSLIENKLKECEKDNICCKTELDSVSDILWLEDIIRIDTSYVVPTYTSLFNSNNQRVGKILKNINLVVEGNITNANYYCCLSGYEMNENFEISTSTIPPLSHSNPALKELQNEDTNLKEYQFLYVIGRKNFEFDVNSNGQVLDNLNNRTKVENTLDSLKKLIYLIESKGINLQNNYFEVGTFNFSHVKTVIIEN